jgi:hypothetical protein
MNDEIEGGASALPNFLPNNKPGLFAVFETKSGEERITPVVGYFTDTPGRMVAAVIPKTGIVTRVSDVEGYTFKCVRWEEAMVTTSKDGSTTKVSSPNIQNVQGAFDRAFATFDRAFSILDQAFGSIRNEPRRPRGL